MKIFYLSLTFLSPLYAEVIIDDDYSSEKLDSRQVARGDWKVKDNSISAPFDEALYKKYNDHGPMVRYSFDSTSDLTIEMEVMMSGISKLCFQVDNAEGHLLKAIVNGTGKGSVRGFKGKESEVLGKITGSVKENVWVPVKLSFSGNKLTFSINGSKPQVFEHPAFQKGKSKFVYKFVKGHLSARKLQVSKP